MRWCGESELCTGHFEAVVSRMKLLLQVGLNSARVSVAATLCHPGASHGWFLKADGKDEYLLAL